MHLLTMKMSVSYKHPQYKHGTYEAQAFFARSARFLLDEIEVTKWKKINNSTKDLIKIF